MSASGAGGNAPSRAGIATGDARNTGRDRESPGKEAVGGLLLPLAALLIVSPILSSCAPDASGGPPVTFRDSAGVAIAENDLLGPDEATGWAISGEPVLSIGAVEGAEALQLYGVSGAHRLADGRIGLVNGGSREVRFYSPEGEPLASYGRRGGGPEEFQAPILGGALGDTLIVVDRALHRFAFVHPEGGFVGLNRVSDDVGGYLNPVGMLAGGQIVFGGAFDMRRIGEIHDGRNRAHTFYRSSNPDGSLATDFGDQPGAEFFIRSLEEMGRDAQPALLPFGKIPLAAATPTHFFFSSQERWEIQVYAPSGELVRLIRQEWEPIAVTEEDGARYVDNVVAEVGDPNQEAAIREHFSGLPLPEHFPPIGSLLGDLDGNLWIQDFQRPGAENRAWSIYDTLGARVGRLTLPDNFDPWEIGEDYVLGIGWDEMHVEYLRVYRLTRPSQE
jgi:hypothetical protein